MEADEVMMRARIKAKSTTKSFENLLHIPQPSIIVMFAATPRAHLASLSRRAEALVRRRLYHRLRDIAHLATCDQA
jgi:hypothetical protein